MSQPVKVVVHPLGEGAREQATVGDALEPRRHRLVDDGDAAGAVKAPEKVGDGGLFGAAAGLAAPQLRLAPVEAERLRERFDIAQGGFPPSVGCRERQ